MRTLTVLLVVGALVSPAVAKGKRHRAPDQKAALVTEQRREADERNRREREMAEHQLSELRTGRTADARPSRARDDCARRLRVSAPSPAPPSGRARDVSCPWPRPGSRGRRLPTKL